MEFRVLGPLEAVGDDGLWSADLGGVKQRALLGALLLDAGRPVPVSRLIEAVWEEPPACAAHAVEVYVSKLRKALRPPDNDAERIVRRNGGYVALVRPDELDLLRFRALTGKAAKASFSGDPATASRMLKIALELWRGEPLACVHTAPVAVLARRELQEERFAAVNARLDADLALGRHAELVSELRRLVTVFPDREGLWFGLMLALYRSDRQVEALETYRLARDRLREQFGIEPSRALRDLQRGILTQDDRLDLPAAVPAARARSLRRQAPLSSPANRPTEPTVAASLATVPRSFELMRMP